MRLTLRMRIRQLIYRTGDVLDVTGPVEEVTPATGLVEAAPEVVSEPRYNLRPTRPPLDTWSTKSLSQRSFGLHLSTRAAIKVSTTSVFLVAALAAKEKRAKAVVDFPGAYLNSEKPKDDKKVHMKLD
jgi:hypothetical protein